MKELFKLGDDLGPAKIIHVYEPLLGLKGILVVDNVAAGPSIGGVRMARDVTIQECVRLARAMTMKNAAAGLPHGGGKAVLVGDPKMPKKRKEKLLRAMASSLRYEEDYIFAPDMGTDEECMAWVRDEIGRVVGLPRELGGIPLDQIGATGWGLSHATDVALNYCAFNIEDARVVIQGFGAVGRHAARYLAEKGARIVAVADSHGAVSNRQGLDLDGLLELKKAGHSVSEYIGGESLGRDDVIDIECDIWIPAARPDVINSDNVERLNTKLMVQGANIPVTTDAERRLHEKGVLIVPDFIANAGGVICAAMEYRGASESVVFAAIEEKVRRNTEQVLEAARAQKILPRQAAVELALKRIHKVMGFRRYNTFSSAPGFI
ncbi:glutamate dehydrogenase (NADP) [Mariprofundus ferrinatatus]|uniref:Glutamate dehydrogenase n=1 Tax=Mariprofundus ferrinatatus TaxID=1921087 RepID=A0A2K8L559_9PROT|nr:Glu/Leu/Phe/Val dehydrogenase [Mariprofundus ferrinatatus]ATX82450.1 glutamate dehydrogenase (NADP) [Mariprofundus ferrinatatus]